mgnify:CR=1 FL=1
MTRLPEFHAAKWDEPVVMELGRPGGRGQHFPAPEDEVTAAVGSDLIPQRHYLHLSQMTLGMMGISLFGTCTMKYNSKTAEFATLRPELATVHPYQHPDTLQGVLEIMHDFDGILRSLSGMDQFIFQAGGGADAAYTMACVARAYWQDRGMLDQRTEMVTSIQAIPATRPPRRRRALRSSTFPLKKMDIRRLRL